MAAKSLDSTALPRAGTTLPNPRNTGAIPRTLAGLGVMLALALPAQAQAQSTASVQMAMNTSPKAVVCPDRGKVQGLDPRGDGFLAVRTGPSTEHEQIDELHNGDVIMLCDYQNGWHGVIYPAPGQRESDCVRSASRMGGAAEYRGPCKAGWVHGNWVRWIRK